MRVLIVHNHYRRNAPSGEAVVIADDRRLLADSGAQVQALEVESDDIAGWPAWRRSLLPATVVWSPSAQRRLARTIQRVQPDVVHIHNTFPLLSPAVFRTAARQPAALVHSLHNFRPLCPATTALLRDGRVCTDCVGRVPWPGVRHACYRNSSLATLPVAVMDGLHAAIGTWRLADRVIAPNRFVVDMYQRAGWPTQRFVIRPHVFTGHIPTPDATNTGAVVCLARLSPEKGVDVLLAAWRLAFPNFADARLIVIGDGDDAAALRADAADRPDIAFTGLLAPEQARAHLAAASVVVVPSRCVECAPRVVIEAYAAGIPVIASDRGGLAEMVDDGTSGLLVPADDPAALAAAMRRILTDDALHDRLAAGARACFRSRHEPGAGGAALLRIYEEAIEHRQRRPSRSRAA